MNGFIQVSLAQMLEAIGEEQTKKLLSDYLCNYNADVQRFLREKAIDSNDSIFLEIIGSVMYGV